jgi:hypothetical protein
MTLAAAWLPPAVCAASCFAVVDPAHPRQPFDLHADLESADGVYVGTIIASRLGRALSTLAEP